MKRIITLIVALVLLSAQAGTDDSPTTPTDPSAPIDPTTPTAPTNPPAPTDPTSPRPDFVAIQKHLVVVKDGLESDARQSPGFSISAEGHVVAFAGQLRDSQAYLVSTAGGQFSATRLKADEPTGLWILKLSEASPGLTGLPFASTALQAAAPLHAVNFNPSGPERFTPVAGTVTQLVNTEQGQMIRHNALFSLASAGTPLLNRCYQAVGINLLEEEGGFFSRPVDPTQKGSALSLAAASLNSLLTSLGLSLPVADNACLSLEEEIQQRLEQERQEQEAARQGQQEAEQKAQRTEEALQREQREKEAAQEQAGRAEADKQRAEEEAQRQLEQKEQEQQAELQRQQDEAQRREAALQREKEEAEQQAAQRQRQILLYGAIIGGLALLGVLLLIRRKQKRLRTTEQEKQHIAGALGRAQSELSNAAEQEQLRSSAPDVFLEGETPPIALKIPGASLVDQAGAVVGRSPSASTFVINHEQVSRQHFRLSLVAQQIMIEDLGSTNGTSVDGVPLEPGNQIPVSEGSRLGLGDLELTLHIGRRRAEQ